MPAAIDKVLKEVARKATKGQYDTRVDTVVSYVDRADATEHPARPGFYASLHFLVILHPARPGTFVVEFGDKF